MTRIAIESFHSMPHQEGEKRAGFFFQQPEDSILLLRSQGRKLFRGKLSTRQLIKLSDAIEVRLRVIAIVGSKRLFDIVDDSGLQCPRIMVGRDNSRRRRFNRRSLMRIQDHNESFLTLSNTKQIRRTSGHATKRPRATVIVPPTTQQEA